MSKKMRRSRPTVDGCRKPRRRRRKSLLETVAEAHAAVVGVCRGLLDQFVQKTREATRKPGR